MAEGRGTLVSRPFALICSCILYCLELIALLPVVIRLHNIQSHQDTEFSFQPGLNVIMSRFNNVGKSAIFKAIRSAAEAPVRTINYASLLRSGCDNGYVSFTYEGHRTTFWLVRQTQATVAGIFESQDVDKKGVAGEAVRTTTCPAHLLKALGIELSPSGTVINFNDATAVQLLVTSSAENDAIITKILTDDRVENMKASIQAVKNWAKQMDQDNTFVVEGLRKSLEGRHYYSAVDTFDGHEAYLKVLCTLLDQDVLKECGEMSAIASAVERRSVDVEGVSAAVEALEKISEAQGFLSDVKASSISISEESEAVANDLGILSKLLSDLDSISHGSFKCVTEHSIRKASDVDVLTGFMNKILGSIINLQEASDCVVKAGAKEAAIQDYDIQIRDSGRVVDCPLLGPVYYSESGCVECECCSDN